MKKIFLIIPILVVALGVVLFLDIREREQLSKLKKEFEQNTVSQFKGRGAGSVEDFMEDYLTLPLSPENKFGADDLMGFYDPILKTMKLKWVRKELEKDAGWLEEYEASNEHLCISISKGLTEDKKQKLAFNASFKEKQVFCHCYFENGRLQIDPSEGGSMLSLKVFIWFFEAGIFDDLPTGNPKIKPSLSPKQPHGFTQRLLKWRDFW